MCVGEKSDLLGIGRLRWLLRIVSVLHQICLMFGEFDDSLKLLVHLS